MSAIFKYILRLLSEIISLYGEFDIMSGTFGYCFTSKHSTKYISLHATICISLDAYVRLGWNDANLGRIMRLIDLGHGIGAKHG